MRILTPQAPQITLSAISAVLGRQDTGARGLVPALLALHSTLLTHLKDITLQECAQSTLSPGYVRIYNALFPRAFPIFHTSLTSTLRLWKSLETVKVTPIPDPTRQRSNYSTKTARIPRRHTSSCTR